MKRVYIFARVAAASLCAGSLSSPARAADTTSATTVTTTTTAQGAQSTPQFAQGLLFPHWILDAALGRAVDKNGGVDYGELQNDKDLTRYVQAVGSADLTLFPTWEIPPDPQDKNAKPKTDHSAELVFWINAYNAHVLKTIADRYPIDSPDEIKDFDSAKTHRVAGTDYSFAEMRARIAALDPRALFTLSDGTQGGPLLAPKAYRFHDLDLLLNNAVKTFVNDDRNVAVLRIANKVTVSDYFADVNTLFTPQGERKKMAGVRAVLSSYSDRRGERAYLITGDYQIILKPRDRRLNSKAK